MSKKFQHLGKSEFPNVSNVDVFKYENELDYSRFNSQQMKITICSVPWDIGEVHVGKRAIGGVGNVVKFENDAERDAWFAAIPENKKYVFETKFRKLHTEDEIKIPLPFNVAAEFNYCIVEYSALPDSREPFLEYEISGGVKKWFYFIRSVEMESNNTTVLILYRDMWQQVINHLNFSYMMVERGHCAFLKTSVEKYLENPSKNCNFLLAPDVNYGEPVINKHCEAAIFNDGDMLACIATNANPTYDWGEKGEGWRVATSTHLTMQGVPSAYVFGMDANNLNTFLYNIDVQAPQFKQTIQAIFFISKKLVQLEDEPFTFCGAECFHLIANQSQLGLIKLNKDMFGYPSQYASITKLYTHPYAQLEITDSEGNATAIRIEDTTGEINVDYSLSIAYPFLNLQTQLTGIGGGLSGNVVFSNISARSFSFGGRWYETLRRWSIPTFAVVQSNKVTDDYQNYYNRAQAKSDYTTARTNAGNVAENVLANNNVAVAAASAVTATTAAANTTGAGYSNNKLKTDVQYDIGNSNASFDAEQAQLGVAATNNNAQAAAGAVNIATSVASSAFSGGLASAGISAIGSAVSTGVNWQTTNASIIVSQSNNANVYNQAITSAYGKQDSAIAFTNNSTALNNSTITANTNTNNSAATATAENNADLINTNAENDVENAKYRIENSISTAGILAPNYFGNFANGDTATTKPQALFANVVTQNDGAIKQAGDQFLRYGYALNESWQLEDFNVMPKFTYWKCSDLWAYGLNIPDEYVDMVRVLLMQGVTVWRKPEYIGVTSIYENVEE